MDAQDVKWEETAYWHSFKYLQNTYQSQGEIQGEKLQPTA